MKLHLKLIVFLLLIYTPLFSQTTFQKLYNSDTYDGGYSSIDLPDGYLIMGKTSGVATPSDILLVKIYFQGDTVWSKKYGGSANEEAFSITTTYDGGFVMAGYSTTFTGPSLSDPMNIYLLKVNATGDLIWSQSINVGAYDAAYSVKETFDHGFIIAGGTTAISAANHNLVLIKTDSLGTTEWFQTLGSATAAFAIGRSVIQTRDSGYAVVGYSTEFVTTGDTAIFLIRASSTGAILNTRHYTLTNTNQNLHQSYGYDIIQNNSGNLIITGAVGGFYSNLFYAYAPLLLETDSIGNFMASKFYELNTGDCRAYSVKQTSNGGYILGGTMGNYYPMMLKTNSSLNTEWCYYYGSFNGSGGVNTGIGFHANPTVDSGYLLTAMKTSLTGTKMQIIKTDFAGFSGCNQGSPTFLGAASTALQSMVPGTVFSIGTGSGFAIISNEQSVSMNDSLLCFSTGVPENNSTNLSPVFYPNPATNEITILFGNNSGPNNQISIYDMTGNLIKSFNQSATSNNTYDISDLRQGIYILKINKKNSTFQKLLKY